MCRFLWPDKEHRQSINGFIVVICLIWIPCRSVAAIKCGNEFADAHKFILTLNFVMVHSLVDYIICVESFSWADTKRNETTTNSYANSIIINNLATMTMLRHRYKMSMQMLCVCHYTELWASSKIVRHRCRQFLHTLRSHMRHTHTHANTTNSKTYTLHTSNTPSACCTRATQFATLHTIPVPSIFCFHLFSFVLRWKLKNIILTLNSLILLLLLLFSWCSQC